MARLITLTLALFNYVLFEAKGQTSCSTLGTAGLTGCECNFLGACDVRGEKKPGLNILNNLPKGLELYACVRNVRSGRNLAFLCEGNTVAIRYDCNNRIPLYAAMIVTGKQLAEAPGTRPRGKDGTFRKSGTGLMDEFQQNDKDYSSANQRELWYYPAPGMVKDIDDNWYKAKYPTHSKSSPLSDLRAPVHRGHMIASRYGIGDYAKKVQTFVYTNAVPQFGTFNSIDWNKCEDRLIRWGQVNCLMDGTEHVARNVQMFIVVGATPSTFPYPSNARFFGSGGFSAYLDDSKFRVNVPTEMWTASCCTFEYTKDGRTYSVTKSTAFWRENVPGKYACNRIRVDTLEEKLTPRGETRIDLFPSSNECKSKSNYEILP